MMKSLSQNLLISAVTIAIVHLFPSAAQASTRPVNAKCLLKIDNVIYMNGKCSFEGSKTSDSFYDPDLLIVCPDGRDVSVSSCVGAEERHKRGVFGMLSRQENEAMLCWNRGKGRRAESCYKGLRRSGACWSNPQAQSFHQPKYQAVKFCAWAL